MTSRSVSEKPKDTSEFKDRTREGMTYTTSQSTSESLADHRVEAVLDVVERDVLSGRAQ